MNLKYAVHSSSMKSYPTELELADGSKITAFVPTLIVELVPVGQHSEAGTIKLALQNADAETVSKFAMGSLITSTFVTGV